MRTTTQGLHRVMDDNDAFLAFCDYEDIDPNDPASREAWDEECEDRAEAWAESRAEAAFEARLMGE